MMQQIRSLLFAPGNKGELLQKFPKIQPDAAIIDLEDAVPDSQKDIARENLKKFSAEFKNEQFLVFARVNPVSSKYFESDLSVTDFEIDGVIIPKISQIPELQKAEALLATSPLSNKIIVGIETVKGLVSASEILAASSVMGAYFGAEDYVADLGGIRTVSNEEVLFARTQMGIAARLNEVPVYDQIVSDFTDTERFVNEAGKARSLGFAGKLCIHPSQVALANTSFSPSGEEIKKAKELLATYEEAVLHGSASVVIDGKMIDEALAKQARWVLSLEN